MIKILENIVARPGLYWGGSNNHFHSLVAFVSGYQLALSGKVTGGDPHVENMIPDDFSDFVAEYFGQAFPHGSHKWPSLIEEHSKSPSEALETFLKLRRLYDETHRGAPLAMA